jgi:hypothetical protein
MNVQQSWRYCQKCQAMFYAGRPGGQGVCAAGGAHSEQGFSFILPYNAPATATAQASWRFCQKCYVMFYAGHPTQGVCADGGTHSAHGDDFVLPHDIPATSTHQGSWRFCEKCEAIFYAGHANQGVCPAGGAHSAHGDDFVLFHGAPSITQFAPFYSLNNPEATTLGVIGSGFYPGSSLELIMQAEPTPGELFQGSPIVTVADAAGNIDASATLSGGAAGHPDWGYPGVAIVSKFQVGAYYEIAQAPTSPAVAAAHATWTGIEVDGFGQGGY